MQEVFQLTGILTTPPRNAYRHCEVITLWHHTDMSIIIIISYCRYLFECSRRGKEKTAGDVGGNACHRGQCHAHADCLRPARVRVGTIVRQRLVVRPHEDKYALQNAAT